MFELVTISSVIRWIIRLTLVYALIRLARSQRPIEAQGDKKRANAPGQDHSPRYQREGLRQRRAPSWQSGSAQGDYSAAGTRGGNMNKVHDTTMFDDVISKLSKPRTLWEANKTTVVAKAPTEAKVPVAQEGVKKVKPKTEKDKREENLQVLRHHTRPVTWICFNKEANLLFSCGKDTLVVAWSYSADDGNWQILAVYAAHTGAVWCCAISDDSSLLCTCGADSKALVWSANELKLEATLDLNGVGKFCEWRTNKIKKSMPTFAVCSNSFGKSSPARIAVCEYHPQEINVLYAIAPESNALQVRWTADELLVSAHECGKVIFWRMAEQLFVIDNGTLLSKIAIHDDMLACALCSGQLKVWTFTDRNAEPLVSIDTDRPLNDVAFDGDVFVVGGGQDAREVALQSVNVEKQFTPLMYLGTDEGLVPKHEGRFRNHFGPIHCLDFTDRHLASGSEDGLVHVETIL